MGDNPEIARARRLLKSSDELLERSRNRPHVEFGEWRSEPEEQAPAPIVHKTIQQPRQRGTMDPESSRAWSDWARSIARAEAHKIGAEVLELSDKGFKVLCDRIDQLEAEVGRLKSMAPEREEWPLRAIKGGRR